MKEETLKPETIELIHGYINSSSPFTDNEDGENAVDDFAFETAYHVLTDPEFLSSEGLSRNEWVGLNQVKKIIENIGEGEPVSSGSYHKGACYIRMKSGNSYVISIRASEKMKLD